MSSPADLIGSFMDDYFAECEQHLGDVRGALLLLESSAERTEPLTGPLEDLFRSFHSLKGISAMVELREAEQLSHDLESVLRALRRRDIALTHAVFDSLVDGVRALEQVIAARRAGADVPPIDRTLIRLRDVVREPTSAGVDSRGGTSQADTGQLWKVTFTPTKELVERGVKVDTIRTRLLEIGQLRAVAPRVLATGGIAFEFTLTVPSSSPEDDPFAGWESDGVRAERLAVPPADMPLAVQDATSAVRVMDTPVAPSNYVRVDLARLDDLMRLVGDLVVSRARLHATLSRVEPFTPAAEWRVLQEHSDSLERHLRDLREGVMRVRLVPVGEIFRRMPFVVRDLARDHGKRIRIDLAGQTTEIDKFLIERMMDPMLHLVRNAVSHGVEPPDQRIAAGKPPEGTIRLSASTLGEAVVLEISDDGRGMDVDAIAQRARSNGINVPEGPIDARTLLDIISAAGFSTRDAADRASGRGVGMAVVRESIRELGGTLSVDTTVGIGTTFRIVLPLTLAITDALIVHVGDRVFAVPQASVREVAEVDATTIRAIERNEVMLFRGSALPVVRLSQLFAIASSTRARLHAIVVGQGAGASALLVDRIAGQREVVVKTLKDPLVKVQGVSGATELGDGRLVLILEPEALTRRMSAQSVAQAAV